MTHTTLDADGRAAAYVIAVALLLLMARCDWATPIEEQPLVVEAFFETGQPLGPITLRTTRPLRAPASDTTAPATGARVTVQLDGQRIAFQPVAGQPGTYAPERAAPVPPRTDFALTAQWAGQTARASGTTPPAIGIASAQIKAPDRPVQAILVDSLRRDSLDIPAEQGYIYPIEVTVAWATEAPPAGPDSTYWIRAQLRPYTPFSSRVVDFFLQEEAVFREQPASGGTQQWTGVYAVPVDDDDDPLPRHRVRVSLIRSGAEYAAFAASRTDPDRREPISNVRGAVGIAAAVALDSVRADVTASSVRIESERIESERIESERVESERGGPRTNTGPPTN